MKFILVMIWLGTQSDLPLVVGPFETEKLCVDAAGQLFAKWKTRRVGGDFLCIPTHYPEQEK